MSKSKSSESVATKNVVTPPSRYKVIMLNDDVTSMEFVIQVLYTIFNKDATEAYNLTMDIHEKGSAVVGTYNKEIAEQKVYEVTHCATKYGYPLVTFSEKE